MNGRAIHFLKFEAAPSPESSDATRHGGAFVLCWIAAPSIELADEQARREIESWGWVIKIVLERSRRTADDYINDDEHRRFYEQALVDGEVFLCHQWPVH